MDTIILPDDAEIEDRLKAKAIDDALKNLSPGRRHAEVRLEIIQTIAELDKEIAAKIAR